MALRGTLSRKFLGKVLSLNKTQTFSYLEIIILIIVYLVSKLTVSKPWGQILWVLWAMPTLVLLMVFTANHNNR